MAQIKVLKIASDGVSLEHTSSADDVTFLSGNFGNVQVSANAVISTDTDGDLALTPNGAGDLVLDGVNWPQADGSINQFLQTDGSGQTSWVDLTDDTIAEQVCNGYTSDEILAARDGVYISAADSVSKCVSSAGGIASRLMGFAKTGVADAQPVDVISEGVLAGFSGLTVGARQFIDPATAGGLTETTPSGAGNTLIQAGYAKSATELHIHIEQLGRKS
jgi:hypothetical protein